MAETEEGADKYLGVKIKTRGHEVEPLEPHQNIGLGVSQDDLNEMPNNKDFKMTTNDIYSMSSLMYAMRDLVGDLKLHADERGMVLSERIANNNIFVYLDMKSSVFEEYECSSDIVLCFEPKLMYACISKHVTHSYMVWELMQQTQAKGGAHYLRVTVINGDVKIIKKKGKLDIPKMTDENDYCDGSIYVYYIPLLKSFKQIYKAEKQRVPFFLAIDTNIFVNDILETFDSLQNEIASKFVELECTKDYINFQMTGNSGSLVNKASFKLLTRSSEGMANNKRLRRNKKDPELSKVGEDECEREHTLPRKINAQYFLIYLLRLKKCFSINRGYFYMYIIENYPLVFKSCLGLGDLYSTIMYVTEDEEENAEVQMPDNYIIPMM